MNAITKPAGKASGKEALLVIRDQEGAASAARYAAGAKASTAIILIKPEELENNTAEGILLFISQYCKDNNLELSMKRMRFTEDMLERQYSGRGEDHIKEIEAKVHGALRGQLRDLKYGSGREAAEDMLRIHRESYLGKEFILVKVTGPDSLAAINRIKGDTDPTKASPDTIRGRFSTGMSIRDAVAGRRPLRNVVHIPRDPEELSYDAQTYGVELA